MAKKVKTGYKYFLGVQLALCHGAVDRVSELIVGERSAWKGEINTSGQQVTVDAKELFGGEKSQGGVAGPMQVYMGADDQQPDSYLQRVCAPIMPAYLGVTTVIFRQFYWAAMNPYFKAPWLRATRLLKGWQGDTPWYPSKLAIGTLDMNPMHIIYQAMTDAAWGMGYNDLDIDQVSFKAAADKLFDEKFGLSLIYEKQMATGDFIQIICDHINASLRLDLRSGKFQIKLIRDGYDASTLLELNEDNVVEMSSFQRAGLGELANQMTVKYTDREQKTQTVTVHNLATIDGQGAIIATSREYLGIREPELAMRVAERDLATLSTPLAKAVLVTNRVLWDKLEGDEVVLTWRARGLVRLPMRITSIDKGSLQSGKIQVELIEDVFGLPSKSYTEVQPPLWVDVDQPPSPSSVRIVTEAPYWDLVRNMSAADLAIFPDDAAMLYTTANRPNGIAYDYGISVGPNYVENGRGNFATSSSLIAAIAPAQTSFKIAAISSGAIEVGTYAVIGGIEIVRVDALTIDGTITVGRGCLDTVTVGHAPGTSVLFSQATGGTDGVQYISGQSLNVKMTPRTGRGELPIAQAPADSVRMVGRQFLPYPPGKFRISGADDAPSNNVYPSVVNGTLTVSWASRNRLVQNLEGEDVGNITPEAGTRYNLRIFSGGTLLESLLNTDKLTHTSGVDGIRIIRVELESVRVGKLSFTKHSHTFELRNTSYLLTEQGDNLVTHNNDLLIKE